MGGRGREGYAPPIVAAKDKAFVLRHLTIFMYVLTGTLVVLLLGIAYASYLSPDFATIAPGLVVAIVTPLVSGISGLAGILVSRGVRGAVEQEVKERPPTYESVQNGGGAK